MSRGFLTLAENGETDYVRLAYGLALSLKLTQSGPAGLSVIVSPGYAMPERYRRAFDRVIELPDDTLTRHEPWKLANEWRAYGLSPYDETIKLDADMLFTRDIAGLWPLLGEHDFRLGTRVLTYRGEVATSDHYRKLYTLNTLPTGYTAMMYFRKSVLAERIYALAELMFRHWDAFAARYLVHELRPAKPHTDEVFSLAVRLLGVEAETLEPDLLRFVHMKPCLQNWPVLGTAETPWTQQVRHHFDAKGRLVVGGHAQTHPFHYTLKDFLTDAVLEKLEKRVHDRNLLCVPPGDRP